MMNPSLHNELVAARLSFHLLLASLSDEDLARRSHNSAWTNKQIIFHMALGFFLLPSLCLLALLFGRLPPVFSETFARLLNSLTRPFNVINALGAYSGGRVFTRAALGRTFDAVFALSLRMARLIPPEEWQRGMFYPTQWEPLFNNYMNLEDVYRFPVRHFYSHVRQIAR
ncbi:MAG TPA: DinB family protein [Herpetosiphonaceae bacterium]